MSATPTGPAGSLPPPPQVEALELDGIRYEQARSGLPPDASDRSGWLRATEIASGRELWMVQIYRSPEDTGGDPLPAPGRPVIYMRAIEAEGGRPVVTDILGRRFAIRPADGAAQPLP